MRRRLFGRRHDFDSLDAAAIGIFPNLLHDDAFQLVCRFQLLFSHGFCLIGRGKVDIDTGKAAGQLYRSA
jgi:hypothetical protein